MKIVTENFFLHVAEVDYLRSEDKYERMINEMRLNTRVICDKVDETNRSLRHAHRKLDKALPIAENDVNKRCVIVCRKNDWQPRRYRIVGRLTTNPLVQELLRSKSSYEVFEYFEHINNPAKAKTDIIKEYQKQELLLKSKITIGDKLISVVRLGSKSYKKFVNDLKDKDKGYEVLASEDSDDGESFQTAQS